jgi:hypothetical protein
LAEFGSDLKNKDIEIASLKRRLNEVNEYPGLIKSIRLTTPLLSSKRQKTLMV